MGFERAGMVCKWQVEIDPFARRVLAKHWPDVRRHDDVKTFPPTDAEDWRVDVICGGFPCQDISVAGKGAGLAGERSGLWHEYARIVRVVRPRYVVVENVAALLTRGLDRVLGDLAACGYDAEWDCIPASAVGAPHRRDRVFIVAYPVCGRGGRAVAEQKGDCRGLERNACRNGEAGNVADSIGHGRQGECEGRDAEPPPINDARRASARTGHAGNLPHPNIFRRCGEDGDAPVAGGDEPQDRLLERNDYWRVEPDVGRVADGVPSRVDRLRGLGNAVVPQVAQWIGERLMNLEG